MRPSESSNESSKAGSNAIVQRLIWFFTLLRALIAFVLLPLLTLFTSVTVIIYGAFGRDEAITYHMWLWSRLVNWYFGVYVIAEGFEKIPQTGGGILAFNHQSHFDIPAITGSSKRLVRYGAKIELFKIPFFGPAIRVAGCLPIARDNRKEVFRIYEDAAKKFQQGIVYALAPEGTRQSEPKIAPFKKGPFIFAVNANVPIIPVVVEGANRVLPKSKLLVNLGCLRRTVRVRVLDPIYLDPSLPIAQSSGGAPAASSSSPAVLDLLERTRETMLLAYSDLQRKADSAEPLS
jgi:1-acyl-sn-glycerol-3-phosphate acyltransferase